MDLLEPPTIPSPDLFCAERFCPELPWDFPLPETIALEEPLDWLPVDAALVVVICLLALFRPLITGPNLVPCCWAIGGTAV
jgi:hypothetical protein